MSKNKFRMTKSDELVKSQKIASPVIPAKAGIQEKQALLDPGFRRGDGFDDFLRTHQVLPPFFLRRSSFVIRYSAVHF